MTEAGAGDAPARHSVDESGLQTGSPEPFDDGIAVGVPSADVDSTPIVHDLASLVTERDEYLHALQRLQADFENYRKRVQRQNDAFGRAARDLVEKLLPVLDTLDLAVAHLVGAADGRDDAGTEDPAREVGALEQARAQFLDVLSREGLERVDGVGVEFDPTHHDAVAHAPDEAADAVPPTTTVDEVLRSGYLWRGVVLRPAMVRVRG